jgi:hypothetical protein
MPRTLTRHVQALGYPELRGYVLGGDFKSVVTLVLGPLRSPAWQADGGE